MTWTNSKPNTLNSGKLLEHLDADRFDEKMDELTRLKAEVTELKGELKIADDRWKSEQEKNRWHKEECPIDMAGKDQEITELKKKLEAEINWHLEHDV